MALCLAHAAAGYLAYEALRPAGPHRPWLLAGAVLLANAPDLDFLPGLAAGAPAAFHRGLTHTLGAPVLVTAAVWVVARWRRAEHPWWWAGFAAAYGSHLLVDWMTVDAVAAFRNPAALAAQRPLAACAVRPPGGDRHRSLRTRGVPAQSRHARRTARLGAGDRHRPGGRGERARAACCGSRPRRARGRRFGGAVIAA